MSVLALCVLASVPLGPLPPVGRHAEFLKSVVRAEELLESKAFPEAASFARRNLPRPAIRIGWNLDAKAKTRSVEFDAAREKAFAAWRTAYRGFSPLVGSSPDVAFHWTVGEPRSLRAVWSEEPGQPRITFHATATNPTDVQNGVQYGIGLWLGLTEALFPNQAMWFSESPSTSANRITFREADNARKNVDMARDLLRMATDKRQVLAARPKATFSTPLKPDAKVVQGAEVVVPVVLANPGNAPLDFRTSSTCGCVSSVEEGTIAPGESFRLDAILDTTEFTGQLEKSLLIYTNAADSPLIEIPIRTFSVPRFAFSGLSKQPFDMTPEGCAFEFWLEVPESAPLTIVSGAVEGMQGTVKVLDEPKEKGAVRFRVQTRIPKQQVFGRLPASVVLTTDDPKFPVLRAEFAVQRGIVALPGSLAFGEGASGPKVWDVDVSSAGKAFSIRSVRSDRAELSFVWDEEQSSKNHRLKVVYNGKAAPGAFSATVVVETSDPESPEVRLVVRGTVR